VGFSDQLTRLGFSSYDQYLASEHWTNFRKRYCRSARPQHCLVCQDRNFQLHHCTYDRLGKENLDDVVPLCSPHHDAVHLWLKSTGRVFVEHSHEAIDHLVNVLAKQIKPAKQDREQKKQSRRERKNAQWLADYQDQIAAAREFARMGLIDTEKVEQRIRHCDWVGLVRLIQTGQGQLKRNRLPPPPKTVKRTIRIVRTENSRAVPSRDTASWTEFRRKLKQGESNRPD
jgi:hypothetical protein